MPTICVSTSDKRQLQDIADLLSKSKKVVVVTGAGISTNTGIPDFRSENGLYSLIQSQYDNAANTAPRASNGRLRKSASSPAILKYSQTAAKRTSLPSHVKGKDLFDSIIWSDPVSASVFYTFIASLRRKIREEVIHTTPTHKFIRTLRDGGRLVRCYTQNIDGLETRDSLSTELSQGKGNKARFMKKVVNKPRPTGLVAPGSELDGGCEVVQLHGDLVSLRCNLCQNLSDWEVEDELTLLGGNAPLCKVCTLKDDERRGRGKRGTAVGSLRPNIVLYGEEHPSADLLSTITEHDLKLRPDVLLIMGTSLKVHGLKVLVKEFAKAVHAKPGGKGKVIFVNMSKPADSVWNEVIDYWVDMDCDAWVSDLKERRKDLWQRQGEIKLSILKDITRSNGKGANLSQKRQMDKDFRTADGKENQRSPLSKTGTTKIEVQGSIGELSPQTPKKKRLALPAETPSKAGGRTIRSSMLPTPPQSGSMQGKTPMKRPIEALGVVDVDQYPSTPSKRRRGVLQVWEDETAAGVSESSVKKAVSVMVPRKRGRITAGN